jgi:hypothetical protein
VLEKLITFIFREHKKYINVDAFRKSLGESKNVQLLSFFDCCREKTQTKSKKLISESAEDRG